MNEALKILNLPIFAYPDFDKPFIVETSPSRVSIGDVLGH